MGRVSGYEALQQAKNLDTNAIPKAPVRRPMSSIFIELYVVLHHRRSQPPFPRYNEPTCLRPSLLLLDLAASRRAGCANS